MSDQGNRTQALSQHPIAAALTPEQIEVLASYLETVRVHEHDVIAGIGEVALYHEEGGPETEVGRMKAGEFAGEMSFFDRVPREIRLRALRADTLLLRLSRAEYERLRAENPEIAVHLLEYAIISMDHLVRRVSDDMASITRYLHSRGR